MLSALRAMKRADVEAPFPVGSRLVAQRLEGDGRLDDEAVGGEASLRDEDVVPFQVDVLVVVPARSRPLRVDPVRLHAQGIEGEDVGAAAVVVGVEVHGDGVVAREIVAPGDPGADGGRVVIVRADGEAEARAVVPEPDLGSFAGRNIVARLYLVAELESGRGCPFLRPQDAVNRRGRDQPAQRHPVLPLRVREGGRDHGRGRQGRGERAEDRAQNERSTVRRQSDVVSRVMRTSAAKP